MYNFGGKQETEEFDPAEEAELESITLEEALEKI